MHQVTNDCAEIGYAGAKSLYWNALIVSMHASGIIGTSNDGAKAVANNTKIASKVAVGKPRAYR
jgi:hypothetical protein